jgi:hypothetical protein
MLSETCLDLARHLDVRVVNAETVRENFPMTSVLYHCGFKVENKERNLILMCLRLKQ